jgi:HlyD family secretion protein
MTSFDADLVANDTSMRRLMRLFLLSFIGVGTGLGGWSVAAKIDSAVVTSGTFAVKSNPQAVQHPEGGVVGAILAKQGQLVQEGQVLVRLDAAKVISETEIVERRLIDLTAERARLEAEQADRDTIQAPLPPVDGPRARQTLNTALAAQQTMLTERRSTRANQLAQLFERKSQVENQIKGLNDQLTAVKGEMEQAAADLEDQRMLDKKGLIRRPILRQTEREVSRLQGQIGDTEARIASARSQLTETQFKIAEATRNSRSEALTQLQLVTEKIAEAEQQRTASLDRLQRLEIRAPRTGLVHELAIHTVGGVIGAGQTVMSIIPNTDPLVVHAKIRPTDIDQVHLGQPATVRISSFKLPTPPELDGVVTNMSPDEVRDERSGQSYFTVTITIAPDENSKLQGKELTPGLPAEVLIRGETRRVITYLTQPLFDRIGLAFREK